MSKRSDFSVPAGIEIEREPAVPYHAVLKAVKRYWADKRGGRPMPSRQDIDPKEIKSLLPQVMLVDVLEGGGDFRYRLLGSKLLPYFPGEAAGQMMSVALAPFGLVTLEATLAVYRAVAIERIPLRITGPGETFAQRAKYFEAILCPLAGEGEKSNKIFVSFSFDRSHRKA